MWLFSKKFSAAMIMATKYYLKLKSAFCVSPQTEERIPELAYKFGY